jgi:tetratricopeptide (TPR) repeat protein
MFEMQAPELTAAQKADERFKRLIAILISSVTIIAAIAAYLQTDAGARAAQANRDAQQYAIRALGLRVSGQADVDYGWYGATHTWFQLETSADSAIQDYDEAAARRYRTVRDRIAELSPMLNAPYFDPSDGENGWYPDYSAYQSDRYIVTATEYDERYTLNARLNNAWDAKANTYVLHLTILAVSLALFGLSTTLESWTRWLFVGFGCMLVSVTTLWMSVTAAIPVQQLPDTAIKAYARGVGLDWRGDSAGAIEAFDEALAIAPSYAQALYGRGGAYLDLAYDFVGPEPEAAQADLATAAADYEAARAAGRDDTSTGWNLGWTYYLLGKYDESVAVSRHALDMNPDLFAVSCNIGVALLADGEVDAAAAEYERASQTVMRLVNDARDSGREPPASLWTYLDACTADLDSLQQRLDDEPRAWTQAPPLNLVTDRVAVRREIDAQIRRMKSMSVALEFDEPLVDAPPAARVANVRYAIENVDENGDITYEDVESFPSGADKVIIRFDYENFQDGANEIWKIYRNGVEAESLRVVSPWEIGESGAAVKPISYAYSSVFNLASGEYTAELYYDGYLLYRGHFIVE